MPDPIPRKDADFLSWSGNFVDAAGRFAAELRLPQHLLDQLAPLRAEFVAAYHRAYRPTGSSVDTRAKNDARIALERPIRVLAGMARATATNIQRIEMGLKPRHVGKARPLPRPTVAPRLMIRGVVGRTINLHICTETGRARPHGTFAANVYWFAGEHPPTDLRQGWHPSLAGRRHHAIQIPTHVPPGTKIWVTAMWMNGSKKCGPTCPPISDYVGGGLGRIGGLKAA